MFMIKKLCFIFMFFLVPLVSHSLVEFSGNVGYNRQVYGVSRENKKIGKTYGTSIAMYLFGRTAIELNYSINESITNENTEISVNSNLDLINLNNTIETKIYGIGLRQAFAGKRARFRPSISFGYAKYIVDNDSVYSFRTKGTLQTFRVMEDKGVVKSDSSFLTLNIQYYLTARLRLNASAKTVVSKTDFDQARDNLRYTVGFSWFL